jgi:hypothetical protein
MFAVTPAIAGPAGDTLKAALYSGALAEGLATLEPMAAGGDSEAAFGVGAIRLTQAIEGLVQALYRHGFALPSTGSAFGPGVTVPIPANPKPEPFDYAGVRGMLQDLVTGLDAARASFEVAGPSGDYVIDINPLKVLIDANGDGKAEPAESLAALIALWSGQSVDEILQPTGEGAPRFTTIGFDRADAYWLAGYSDVLAAQADFLLAHDFSDFVNATFHRIFPKAGFPMQDYSVGGTLIIDPQTDVGIADLVAAIHTVSWPVIEPDRLKGVLGRLKAILGYSRQNWDAILAETDDNHELVPSPRQTAIAPGVAITDDKVAAWRATLEEADRILDGQLLLPHWRFKQGFDLRTYFETAKRTDLVMIITGLGAVPFLRDGPVAAPEDFRDIQAAFGNDWLGYAFWFN